MTFFPFINFVPRNKLFKIPILSCNQVHSAAAALVRENFETQKISSLQMPIPMRTYGCCFAKTKIQKSHSCMTN